MTDPRRITDALAPQPGDFDHPAHELLVAYVDGLADEADAEWVESHMVVCAICREDAADLRDMQRQLQVGNDPTVPVAAAGPWRRMVMYGSLAAGLALMAWAGGAFDPPRPEPEAILVSTPPPAAPEPTPAAPESVPTALTAADRRTVDRALESGKPAWPSFHDVIQRRVGTLLGGSPTVAPLTPTAPTATAVITARPEFTWSAGIGATAYEVSVYSEDFAQVATSGPVTQTSWRPDRDLPRGQILTWQISATTPTGTIVSPAPPQPEARFVVLSVRDTTAIADARARLSDEPLALGITLAEAGLYREAEAALVRAATDARYDAAQVQKILAALRAR